MNQTKWPRLRFARRTLLSTGAASLGLGVAGIGRAMEDLRIAYFKDFAPVSYLEAGVMKGVLVELPTVTVRFAEGTPAGISKGTCTSSWVRLA